jgi:GTP-binding protein
VTKPASPTLCPFVDARFHAQAKALEEIPPPMHVEIAFAGRSNVGKSSLLNALLERKNLVRTSQTPGCTQAINFFEARTREGMLLDFVDLPGYGYAERSKSARRQWGPLIEGYLSSRITLRAVVLLIDVRRDLEAEELDLLDWLASPPHANRPPLDLVLAATKTDQLNQSTLIQRLQTLSHAASRSVFGVSVNDSRSVIRLRNQLLRLLVPSVS